MIIDSHVHVWDRSRARYAWLGPRLHEVDRNVTIDEILPTLDQLGIDGVVLVQSADEAGDTENMLEVAATNPRVLGVVGWVPLEDPLEAARRLEELRSRPEIVGIRNLVHDRPDPDWVLHARFDAGLGLLEDAGLPFDFVTSGPDALSRLVTVVERHPALRIVVDHLGKPPIDGSESQLSLWGNQLREVAAFPGVFAKISGLYAIRGTPDSWTDSSVNDAVAVALEAFGPDRVMYGGDWPMSTMAGGYTRVFRALRDAVSEWSDEEQEKFFWKNAAKFYRLTSVTGRGGLA